MSSPSAAGPDGNYRIEVANFGPIGHARVDLRPLTVFAGPSNTGKSYLATLVYALHRCFDPINHDGTIQRLKSLPDHNAIAKRVEDWRANEMDPLPDDLAEEYGEPTLMQIRWQREPAPLPDDVAEKLRAALEQPAGAERYLEQEVRRCFGVDTLGELIRQESPEPGAAIALCVPQAQGREPFRYRFKFGPEQIVASGQVSSLPELSSIVGEESIPYFAGKRYGIRLLQMVLYLMFRSLIKPLTQRVYYLPADRTGVMHSHQVLVSTLIQSATTAGVRPSTNVPLLSGVVADFLEGLIGMSRMKRPARAMSEVVEENLLAGAIRLRHSETGYPSFAYRPANWDADLPLMRTSSMVSELAPVVLYLRYLVRPGDLLIIEEPESHLHPAMQARFARELARLVRFGVRIMLTTHSEWMLEALANLVRLSDLQEPQREGIPGADVALTPGQVGAWLFKPSTGAAGTVVEEIPLDVEVGTYPAGFDEVTESLYNEWVGISNRIEAARADRRGRRRAAS